MRPPPPEPPESLPGDLAWFLAAYNRLGFPFSVGAMTGLMDRRAEAYAGRMAMLDREWPAELDREAPEAIFEDLDGYHLDMLQTEMKGADG